MSELAWSDDVLAGDAELEADPAAPGRCRAEGCEGERHARTWFCEDHYRETLKRVAAELADGARSRRNGQRIVKPKPKRAPGDPDALGRRPIPVRAAELARAVHERGGIPSAAEAAELLGLSSVRGTLSRVVRHAKAQGWIVSRPGGGPNGYAPGDVKPPAASAGKAAGTL